MNYRITIALAAVLAVLTAATWFAGQNGPSSSSATGSDRGTTLIAAAADDITEIDVLAGGRQVVARRADGEWTYRTGGSGAFEPADSQRIRSLTTRLAGLRSQSTVAEQPDEAALKEYGLDNPAMTFTVKTAAGDRTLTVGGDNARRTGKYVQAASGGPVYLVETFLLEDLRSLTTQPPTPPTPTPAPTPTTVPEPTATPAP